MLRNGLEPWHLLIVAIVIIALFGSKKLPEAARGLGKSLRILKSETKAMKEAGGIQPPAAATGDAPADPALRVIQAPPKETGTTRPTKENHAAG
ncbi:Sec-independent protein translocase TatA [Streptomyces sp. IMTB 2501]|uniref:Sec-independent protein translocase subunit TatA n=1 Tax=Streptomyces sp. IMTB 2501 TaxID=1776340 RepID=UPI00096DE852|nr:Sec-independent protein translocase subunit TatA [Streptomyces sp. IMTB 2501]OLZ68434.1 Sec-independent protein translocase TatA [Streptomyces sp. IMTB 2501]